MSRGAALLLVGSALAACTVGPNFLPPAAPIAEASNYLDTGIPARTPLRLLTRTSSAEPAVEWWLAFRDPILASLEERVAAQNLDVQTATARLFQSRAQLGSAAAAGLPTLTGQGSAYRQQFSKNGTIGLLSNSLGGLTGGSGPAAAIRQRR